MGGQLSCRRNLIQDQVSPILDLYHRKCQYQLNYTLSKIYISPNLCCVCHSFVTPRSFILLKLHRMLSSLLENKKASESPVETRTKVYWSQGRKSNRLKSPTPVESKMPSRNGLLPMEDFLTCRGLTTICKHHHWKVQDRPYAHDRSDSPYPHVGMMPHNDNAIIFIRIKHGFFVRKVR